MAWPIAAWLLIAEGVKAIGSGISAASSRGKSEEEKRLEEMRKSWTSANQKRAALYDGCLNALAPGSMQTRLRAERTERIKATAAKFQMQREAINKKYAGGA